eukprot:1473495-Pleurochrysis_carterae.AAC.1
MSKKLAHVVRRISELADTLLDVKITMARATGQLSPTVTAIRDVLSELEAREQKSAFDSIRPTAVARSLPSKEPLRSRPTRNPVTSLSNVVIRSALNGPIPSTKNGTLGSAIAATAAASTGIETVLNDQRSPTRRARRPVTAAAC